MSMIDKAKLQLTKCAKCLGCDKLDDDSFRGDDKCRSFKAAKPDMEMLKRTYNDTLRQVKKGWDYMDGSASSEDKELKLPKLKEIHDSLGEMIVEIKRAGYEMTDHDILEGFKC